jgi:hypothetical protein
VATVAKVVSGFHLRLDFVCCLAFYVDLKSDFKNGAMGTKPRNHSTAIYEKHKKKFNGPHLDFNFQQIMESICAAARLTSAPVLLLRVSPMPTCHSYFNILIQRTLKRMGRVEEQAPFACL